MHGGPRVVQHHAAEPGSGGPEAPKWSQHWIPSTNQHPIGMGTKQSMSHGACGLEWSREMRERWSKMMSKLPHAQRSSNAEFATARVATTVIVGGEMDGVAGVRGGGTAAAGEIDGQDAQALELVW